MTMVPIFLSSSSSSSLPLTSSSPLPYLLESIATTHTPTRDDDDMSMSSWIPNP